MFRSLLLAALDFTSIPALAGEKVAVCHAGTADTVKMLNISANAEAAHLDHGDWTPDTWYADEDGDGYGDAAVSADSCDQPEGFVANSSDLDDTNASITDGSYVDYCEIAGTCDDDGGPTDDEGEGEGEEY